jgi:hypothetical protein
MESSTTVPNQIPNQSPQTPALRGNEVVSAGGLLKVLLKVPDMNAYIVNYKCTRHELTFFSPPVTVSEFNGKKYLWCKHFSKDIKREGNDEILMALPRHTIVTYHFGSGTHRHTCYRYDKVFVVDVHEESEIKIKNEVGNGEITLTVQNLKPLIEEELEFNKVKVEMELSGFTASKSYEDVNVNAFRILKLAKKYTLTVTSDVDKQIEELQKTIEQKKKELEELERQLQELIKQKSISGRIASVVK